MGNTDITVLMSNYRRENGKIQHRHHVSGKKSPSKSVERKKEEEDCIEGLERWREGKPLNSGGFKTKSISDGNKKKYDSPGG